MKISLDTDYLRILLGTVFLIVSPCLTGCGQTPPQKEIPVKTHLNKPGICENCQKNITTVTAENLMTHSAIQYVICDQKCTQELQEKLTHQ